MKKYILTLITLGYLSFSNAQETVVFPDQSSVITTGVPFMLIAPDARAAGMGDMGVATSVDVTLSNGMLLNMLFLKLNQE